MSDPKPPKRIKASKKTWEQWHDMLSISCCVVCGRRAQSFHHLSRHPRDDVLENLVSVCGSGTTGCHGKIEARDRPTLASVRMALTSAQRDYLVAKRSLAWLDRHYPVPSCVVCDDRGCEWCEKVSSGAELDGAYERNDPKHPDFHSTYSDIWDLRDKGADAA